MRERARAFLMSWDMAKDSSDSRTAGLKGTTPPSEIPCIIHLWLSACDAEERRDGSFCISAEMKSRASLET